MRRPLTMLIIFLLSLGLQVASAKDEKQRKILYYRNPMDPSITSPTFMKDSMGMDYIPVYEEDEGEKGESIVKVNLSQQQLIGVKTEPAITRPLMRMIRTVARIAYDPELYKAEQEFIQANKTLKTLGLSESSIVKERAQGLVEASGLKLRLNGLSAEQIEELRNSAESDRSLLISDDKSPYVWVYGVIYEYDISSINPGDDVVLTTIAYPNEEFSGIIKSMDPVLDPMTRSVRIRALIENKDFRLRPNMYGDILIHIDLGKQLAIPREAVLDTGLRKLVYVDLGKGQFKAKSVEVGPEAIALVDGQERKFFPVINGLNENDIIVTAGNFLIDSQSQLTGGMSALWGGATEINQEEVSAQQHQH